MSLAYEIVELFEQLLEEKGIEIPCQDETEQRERHDGDNRAKLYGMEYAKLVEDIEFLLANITCNVHTDTTAESVTPVTFKKRYPERHKEEA